MPASSHYIADPYGTKSIPMHINNTMSKMSCSCMLSIFGWKLVSMNKEPIRKYLLIYQTEVTVFSIL